MGVPDHISCHLRNLHASQEAISRTAYWAKDWFRIGKGIQQAEYGHSAYITSMQRECMLSCFRHVWLFASLWTKAHQTPLFMEFSRQEYWSGLPCLPPGNLPNPGIKLASLMSSVLAGKSFTTSATWECLSCKMSGWMNHKLESRLLGEISTSSDSKWCHPIGRKWRTKEPTDEGERGEWKNWLEIQH